MALLGELGHLRHERLHRALSAGDTLLLPIHARNTVVDELSEAELAASIMFGQIVLSRKVYADARCK